MDTPTRRTPEAQQAFDLLVETLAHFRAKATTPKANAK